MARVTVEDCVTEIPNRFELVLTASQRAREIHSGAELTVERDNDKDPVVALREIADRTVDIDYLKEELIKSQQKYVAISEPEDEELEILEAEKELADEIGIDFEKEVSKALSEINEEFMAGVGYVDMDEEEEVEAASKNEVEDISDEEIEEDDED